MISRCLGSTHPEPAWGKPIQAHMFSNEIGHSELHYLVKYYEIVQVSSDINRISKTSIQSKRHRHPLSKICSSNGDFSYNFPTFLIMLSIRWSYNAFLKYIRNQVVEFSKVISSRMIKN